MSTDNPKALLSTLEKQIATAKDTFAEIERIERFRKQQEDEKSEILETVDPENRDQMRRLTEINTQLEVLPRRVEKALSKQAPAVQALFDTSAALDKVIADLAHREAENLLDEIEPKLRPYNAYLDAKGALQNDARAVAGRSTIFGHISQRSTVEGKQSVLGFHGDIIRRNPEGALTVIQRYAERQIVLLSEYFANSKSFVAPGFRKGAE